MTAAKRVYIDAEGEDALEKSYRYQLENYEAVISRDPEKLRLLVQERRWRS